MAWYKNTSLWSVLIASVAIVLSQLPPIITWVPRPKIEVQHTDRIGINNAIGIIGYNLNVELRNIGNTDIQIEKMILEISRPDGKVISYPAENFTRISTGNTVPVALPITSISIPRNGAWSEMVFFNRQVSTQDEELFLKIRQDIAQSIFDKQQKEGERFDIRASIPADDDVVEAAMNFFTENFDLEKGNYKISLKVYVDDKAEPFVKKSEFTVFEHHLKMIRSQTEDYKYGAGVTMPMNPAKQVWVKFKG